MRCEGGRWRDERWAEQGRTGERAGGVLTSSRSAHSRVCFVGFAACVHMRRSDYTGRQRLVEVVGRMEGGAESGLTERLLGEVG